jgi:hypothetical protein
VQGGRVGLAIGRFFKSLVNAEVMGEEIVRSIIHLYEQTARYNPGDSTQDLLLKTYLARLKARRINIDDERVVLNAMADIHLPAQLPEGKNIKALALYCLFKERPDIIETYPKFAAEYERLMAPILEPSSVDDDDIDPLKSSYEPEHISQSHEGQAIVKRNVPATNIASSSNTEKHNNRVTQFVQSNTPENAKQSAAVAAKYADIKRSNNESAGQQKKLPPRLKNELNSSINNTALQPELSDEEQAKKFAWLKDNAKYFLRIRSEGRTLNEYQEGIIEKYEQWLAENPKLKDN